MSRLNLRIDGVAIHTTWCVLLLAVSANGANRTVMSGGGGNFTTIQACATAMSAGDTCTVYAGTYNENVTVPAGTAGNYKTITVNGSDVVTVQSFTLNSHTKLIGNCPAAPSAINTCGFNIQNPSSPSSAACVGLPNGTTDVYIRNNVMYACGGPQMVGHASNTFSSSYIYIQGNTLSYACVTAATAGPSKECDGIIAGGNHWLVENNNMSHYTLGMYFNGLSYGVFRNNTIHDEYETEAGGNAHTDAFFAEPQVGTTSYNVIEGNRQYNGVGADAKGILIQGDSCTTGCSIPDGIIFRYNTTYDIDGRSDENDCATSNAVNPCSTNVKFYNDTYSNIARQLATSHGDSNDTSTHNSINVAALNNIYYFDFAISVGNFTNPVGFDSSTTATGVWGHDLGYCNVSGASNCPLMGKIVGQGSWTDGPGNIYGRLDTVPTNNPNFVNLAGKDFHLQAGSPAIGAGTYLTTVASGDSGAGTSLVVTDATYFQDGYGLSNIYSTVYPDCVAVGTVSNQVCITAVNYATNTLTLASGISRSAGQGVYLYSKSDRVQVLTGAAPDLGAYPYGGGNSQCPSFSPVDQFVNMNGQTPGTGVTTANLAAATEGTSLSWAHASAYETFAASQVAMPAAITINGGSTHECGYATQSLAMNDAYNQTSQNQSTLTPGSGHSLLVVSGWISNLPPDQGGSGSLWDLVVTQTSGGAMAIVQLVNGTDQGQTGCSSYGLEIEISNGGTFHAGCITVSPGGTYFFSFKVDRPGNLASLAIYTTSGATFTQVGSTLTHTTGSTGDSNSISIIALGNGEAGTAPGTTTYFQNMMVDWTNHVFPNVPTGGDSLAPPTNPSAVAQ